MTFSQAQRENVRDTIQEVSHHREWKLYACNVRTNHVHIVVRANDKPEKVLNDIKAYTTRRLREANLTSQEEKVWAYHGSTRYLNDEDSLETAWRYVIEGQGNDLGGMATDDGQANSSCQQADKIMPVIYESPLPDGRGSLRTDWQGGLTFYPDRYAKTFQTWHENLRDWCISRQLWWGHRIPVWTWSGTREELLEMTDDNQEALVTALKGESDSCSWIIGPMGREYRSPEDSNEFLDALAGLFYEEDENDIYTWFICTNSNYSSLDELSKLGFVQDPDVLDTWFSSGLWPLSTMGWPDDNELLKAFNPGSVLCTAREIITLWVSRMVMFNLYFRDCLPFHDVFIHAMIQDGQGQKMSKSLGNGVDPLDIIHSHGADAMRFTLASMTTLTQDVRMPVDIVCPYTGEIFEPKFITNKAGHRVTAPIQTCPTDKSKKFATSYGVVSGEVTPSEELPLARNTSSKFDVGRNFSNKLWNASRFALTNLESSNPDRQGAGNSDCDQTEVNYNMLLWEDRWILSQLAQTAQTVTDQFENYKFSEPAGVLYRFFWNDLCDWYLEIIKPRMRDDAQKPIAQKVLAYVLDAALRLLHPIIPFITENIYSQLNALYPNRNLESVPALEPSANLITAAWPGDLSALICDSIATEMDLCQTVVRLIRDIRSRYNVAPREPVEVSIKAEPNACDQLTSLAELFTNLTNLKDLNIAASIAKPSNAAVAVEGSMEVYVHNVIDTEAEKERLLKQKEEITGFITSSEKKLANENFVSRAKPEVVQRERDRLADLRRQLTTIESNLADLTG